jgi:hypothetical protein
LKAGKLINGWAEISLGSGEEENKNRLFTDRLIGAGI